MTQPIQEKRPEGEDLADELDDMADDEVKAGHYEQAERLRREARRIREEATCALSS